MPTLPLILSSYLERQRAERAEAALTEERRQRQALMKRLLELGIDFNQF